MVRILPLIIGLISSAICVSSSSSEFVLSSLSLDSDIPFDTYSPLKYNEEGIVGLYADCDTCYNFTGLITDEGYFEITESSEGVFANSKYLNIDETTGLFTVNETADTNEYVVSTHLLYTNSLVDYTILEVEDNKTYHLYFLNIKFDIADLGNNFSSILNTLYPNGSSYLSYSPSEASETASISSIDNVSPSTKTASASASSVSSSIADQSSSSTAGTSYQYKKDIGVTGLVTLVFGYVYIYGF